MVEFKSLRTVQALSEISKIEASVWGIDPLPVHQTLTAVKNGGIVIGAYDNNEMIGFSYGFPGFKDNKVYLCSHMLGIDARYRSKKIGEQMKERQRAAAVEKGYSEMHWTFDPLETRNAYLNLTKLNGISFTYLENAYGDMKDGINQGLPSDRFEVHWFLTSPHVTEKHSIDTEGAVDLNSVSYETGLPVSNEMPYHLLNEKAYAVKVPKAFQELKHSNHALALDWRYKTRALFTTLFNNGYAAVHLGLTEDCAVYTFVKKDTLNL